MDNIQKVFKDYTSKDAVIRGAIARVKTSYYPTLIEIEKEVLRRFCHDVTQSKYSDALANALFRGGIKSMYDLYDTPEEQIMRIRGIGEKRRENIQKMKKFLYDAVQKRSESTCE